MNNLKPTARRSIRAALLGSAMLAAPMLFVFGL